MSVTLADDDTIILAGVCPIEDAEVLLQFLLQGPSRPIDWAACEHAHTAVIQILLAARPAVRTGSPLPFLRQWIEPALSGSYGGRSSTGP